MQAEPPLRPDGRCLVCGGPRKLSGLKLIYRQAMESDPFCSSACARAWWGTSLPAAERPSRRAYVTQGDK